MKRVSTVVLISIEGEDICKKFKIKERLERSGLWEKKKLDYKI